MVVTCENCATRFKFDERRIKPQGIKVHCSRCRRTFLLMPPGDAKAPETAPPRQEAREPERAAPRETPAATPPPAATAADPPPPPETEPGPQAYPPEDDFLADVPGFDPDEHPPHARFDPSEEEKALEALTRDERLDAGVTEALDRFGAPSLEEARQGGRAAEGGGPVAEPDRFETAGGDPAGEAASVGAGAGGEGQEEDRAGGEIDLSPEEGDEDRESGGTPEDFDWDQVSFSKVKGSPDLGPVEEAGSAGDWSDDDTPAFLGSGAEEGGGTPYEGASGSAAQTPARRSPESDALELDLSGVTSKRAPGPPASQAAIDAPVASVAPAVDAEARRPAAPVLDRALQEKPAAPKKVKPVAVPPLRLRARPGRDTLAVPKLAGLLVSLALGVLAAAVGAYLSYAPARGGSQVARAAGGAADSAALLVEDARGVVIHRLQGDSLYLVTGTARWREPARGSAFLEGVIVDTDGEVLERRPARLGEPPDWRMVERVDPDLFTPATPLPPDGETPFSLLFSREPTWRGEVRFDLRTGRRPAP